MTHQELIASFTERFGDSKHKLRCFYAPGRVNLIGDHTDHCGGLVFPCAIDCGTVLMIRRRDDNLVKLSSMNFELMASLEPDELRQKYGDHWINYVLGVIDQFRQKGLETTGFECLFSGNIPNGAGLSSSASVEVVTAFALNTLYDGAYSPVELVKLALAAENEFVGVQCGIMDQYASAMGQAEHAMMLDCHSLDCQQVPLGLDGYRIVIVNSNQRRDLVDSKYNERFQECQQATRDMQVHYPIKYLAELTADQVAAHSDASSATVAKRARHVVTEHQRVKDAVVALNSGDLKTFGKLMVESHQSLSQDFECSTDTIDTLINISLAAPGVIGSRMTGGGFGGCTVNLVAADKVDAFTETVAEQYRKQCGLIADFYPVQSDNGMREIAL